MKRMIFAIAALACSVALAPTSSYAWGGWGEWDGGWHRPFYHHFRPHYYLGPGSAPVPYGYGYGYGGYMPYAMPGPTVIVRHYWWYRTRVYRWGYQNCDVCY